MNNIDFAKLAEPFRAEDIEWRVQQAGGFDKKAWALVLAYVTNRAIMERLDAVCGAENWRNEFDKAPDGGVMCGISILTIRQYITIRSSGQMPHPEKSGIGEWVTKWDGAQSTDIEAVKGGLSNAMKRAGVQWGIGRYLYNLESNFVTLNPAKPDDMTGWNRHYEKTEKKSFYWRTPSLPKWALSTEVQNEQN